MHFSKMHFSCSPSGSTGPVDTAQVHPRAQRGAPRGLERCARAPKSGEGIVVWQFLRSRCLIQAECVIRRVDSYFLIEPEPKTFSIFFQTCHFLFSSAQSFRSLFSWVFSIGLLQLFFVSFLLIGFGILYVLHDLAVFCNAFRPSCQNELADVAKRTDA